MSHYIDLCIRQIPDIVPAHILEKLFGKIHLSLVELRCSDIGISFPKMDEKRPSLGPVLRLHGPEPSLRALMGKAGIAAMRDYVRLGDILTVPLRTSFRLIRRVQTQSSVERLRRRLAKRHNLNPAEAAERIPESAAQKSNLPFIRVRSASSGQIFNLFISQGKDLEAPSPGVFNAYGLSSQATIPWF